MGCLFVGLLLCARASGQAAVPVDSVVDEAATEQPAFVVGLSYGHMTLLGDHENVDLHRIYSGGIYWRFLVFDGLRIGGSFSVGGSPGIESLQLVPLVFQAEVNGEGNIRPYLSVGGGVQMERNSNAPSTAEFDQKGDEVSGFFLVMAPGIAVPVLSWLEMQVEMRIKLIQDDSQEDAFEIQSGLGFKLGITF